MNRNLRKLNEDQLWDLYRRSVENAADIKREIQRRLKPQRLKVVRDNRKRF